MDRFFDADFPSLSDYAPLRPSMDIYEKGPNVIAEMNVPGIDADKIEISIKDGILHIAGTSEQKEKEQEKGYWRKEIRRGSFERLIRLPVPVNEKKIKASCENGILVITIPKDTAKIGKKVAVKVTKATPKKISKRA